MIILKFNTLSAEDLFTIERHLVRWLTLTPTTTAAEKKIPLPPINPGFNVLDYGRTEVYGHLLGIFAKLHVLDTLGATPSQLLDFLIDVDNTYINTPYHSFYHAVDVVTILYYILTDLGADQYLSGVDIAALLIAALCHDAGHPGYSNLFQVNYKTELAAKYKNTSVLESYSVDITRQLLQKHKLLKCLTTSTADHQHSQQQASEMEVRFTNWVGSLILSTDMVHHYELLDHAHRLEAMLAAYYEDEGVCLYNHDDEQLLLSDNDRLALSEILLHAADISNIVRPWPISKQWSDLIVCEFFRQGDAEKAAGLLVSPGMDREQSTQAEISLGFGNLLAKPYFEALARFLPGAYALLDTLARNRCEWEHLKYSPETTLGQVAASSSFLFVPPPPRPHPPPLLDLTHRTNWMQVLGGGRRRVTMATGMITLPDQHHHKNKIVSRHRYRQSSQFIPRPPAQWPPSSLGQRGTLCLYPRDQRRRCSAGAAPPICKTDPQLHQHPIWQQLLPSSRISSSPSSDPALASSLPLLFHPHARVSLGQE